MRALVTVEVGENDVCKLSWVVKGENAEKEEREWVLVKVPDGEA